MRRRHEWFRTGGRRLTARPAATVPRRVAFGAAVVLGLVVAGCGTVLAPTPGPSPTAASPHPIPTISPYVAPAIVVPHDRGRRPHANGSAEKTRGGYTYTVAKDDTAIGIGYRFSVCTADVFHANGDDLDIDVGVRLTIRRVTDEPIDGSDCNL